MHGFKFYIFKFMTQGVLFFTMAPLHLKQLVVHALYFIFYPHRKGI